MMTPLSFPTVQALLKNEVQSYADMNVLLQNAEQQFAKALNQQYLSPEERDNGEFAAAVWMYACMVDAAINEKDYPAAKYDCEKEWETAVKKLSTELRKKKFITGKPIHNVPKICVDAAAALRCLDAENCGKEVIAWVRESGDSLTELFESVHLLDKRLHKASEKSI